MSCRFSSSRHSWIPFSERRFALCILFLLGLPIIVSGLLPTHYWKKGRTDSSFLNESYDDYDEDLSSLGKRRRLPRRSAASSPDSLNLEKRRTEARRRHIEALKDPTLLTNQVFAERKDISASTKRAISEVLGLQQMTEIQAKTYAAALDGKSVLGRARTGTGKTLAFLLPAVERLLEADLDLFKPGLSIGVIVLVPTRELAIQIADQAEALLAFHNDMDVACVYGGTKLQRDIRLLSGPRLPTVLVATPGRLLELMDIRIGRRKFSDIAQQIRIVVLDEADQLLDGFSRETQKILSFLPRTEKRQTLLFSATISQKLRGFIKGSMNIQFEEIDCVNNHRHNEGETNIRVEQTYTVLNSTLDYTPTLVSIVREAFLDKNDQRVLVFFPAGKLVRFFAKFFSEGLGIQVLEIHSRMSQASRMRASSTFRSKKKGILFTSDVSARGMDYDVSLVIQFGAPVSTDAYIHRIGRTGRAGHSGRSLLVLLPFERYMVKKMSKRGLAMTETSTSDRALDVSKDSIDSVQKKIRCNHASLTPSAESACRAFVAYYVNRAGGIDPAEFFQHAGEFSQSVGLREVPSMDPDVVERLGLDGFFKTS